MPTLSPRRLTRFLAILVVSTLAGAGVLSASSSIAVAATTGANSKSPHEPTIRLKLFGRAATSTAPDVVAKARSAKPTIKMKLLVNSTSPLLTDGARWAVYEPTEGVTRLTNTTAGGSVSRPDPEGCAGGLVAIGGGELLYACSDPECPSHADDCTAGELGKEYENARYVVEDIRGGAQHPLAGETHLPSSSVTFEGGPGRLEAIGQQWAMGDLDTHGGGVVFFVNWHTGAIEYEGPSANAAFYDDLDSAELLQPLCEPLTRPTNAASNAPLFAPTQYEPPFTVTGPLGYEQVFLQLRRCGSGKRVPLPEGGPYASSVQLGGDVLSWLGSGRHEHYTRDGGAYVTQLLTRGGDWHGPFYRLLGLPGPKILESYAASPTLQHTSTMVFVTVRITGSTVSQVYRARLPWVHAVR